MAAGRRAFVGEHDVGGLEIAVDEAAFFRRDERAGDLEGDFQHHAGGQRPQATHARVEGLAVHELHRVKTGGPLRVFLHERARRGRGGVPRAEVINRGDVRVAEPGGAAGLAQKKVPRPGMRGVVGIDDLQSHGHMEVHVHRLVRHAHRAAAQLERSAVLALQNLVVVIKRATVRGRRRRVGRASGVPGLVDPSEQTTQTTYRSVPRVQRMAALLANGGLG